MFGHLPIKRRRLLRGLVLGGVAACVAPFVYAAEKFLGYQGMLGGNKTAVVTAVSLTVSNPSAFVEVEGEPVIVVREPDETVRAFTATCTHLGCTVNYRPRLMIGSESAPGFYCRCHGGKFDHNGVNVPGTPPNGPLTELAVVKSGNDFVVSLTPKKKET